MPHTRTEISWIPSESSARVSGNTRKDVVCRFFNEFSKVVTYGITAYLIKNHLNQYVELDCTVTGKCLDADSWLPPAYLHRS